MAGGWVVRCRRGTMIVEPSRLWKVGGGGAGLVGLVECCLGWWLSGQGLLGLGNSSWWFVLLCCSGLYQPLDDRGLEEARDVSLPLLPRMDLERNWSNWELVGCSFQLASIDVWTEHWRSRKHLACSACCCWDLLLKEVWLREDGAGDGIGQ
jgi:hypothetical protein